MYMNMEKRPLRPAKQQYTSWQFILLSLLTITGRPAITEASRGNDLNRPTHGDPCTVADAQNFKDAFVSSGWTQGNTKANCPDWFWLEKYATLYPDKGGVFLDVGCNVGYSSARLFSSFKPELQFTPQKVFEFGSQLSMAVAGLPADQTCGACSDCRDAPLVLPPRPDMEIHCFEASKNHFTRLLLLRGHALADKPRQWHLHNVAISNSTEFVNFPAEGCGELCSVDARDVQGSTILGYDATISITLDAILHKTPHVAFMKIDTEGHEPSVFHGARRSLLLGKFDIFTFEYSEVGAWAEPQHNLSTMLLGDGPLAKAPYTCFLDGQGVVIPISGSCMRPEYNYKTWSNMVCVHNRLRELISWMMDLSRGFADNEKKKAMAPANKWGG